MNRVYDLRPGLKWWANSGPTNSGWGYEPWGYLPIPERNLLVMITPKVACTSVVKALLKRYHPSLYEQGLRRVELVEESRQFSVWHSICGENNLLTFDPKAFEGFQTIGLIRDPVSRFLSGYLSQGDGPDSTAQVPHTLGVLDFLQWLLGVGPFQVDKHFAPQWRGWDDRATLFPLEVPMALKEFLRAIDVEELPHENKSAAVSTGGHDLTFDFHARNFVGALYAEDFRVWKQLSAQWTELENSGKKGNVVAAEPKPKPKPKPEPEPEPGKLELLKDPGIETATMAVGEGDVPDSLPADAPTTRDVMAKIEELKAKPAGESKSSAGTASAADLVKGDEDPDKSED